MSDRMTLPLDQVEQWYDRWKSRPRSEQWAQRYGADAKRIDRLFADSMAALREHRELQARDAAEKAAQNKRIAQLTRVAAAAVLVALLLSLGMFAYAATRVSDATKAANAQIEAAEAQSANVIAEATNRTAQAQNRANVMLAQATFAQHRAAIAVADAKAQRAQAQAATAQAQASHVQANEALAQAQSATTAAGAAKHVAQIYTAQSYLAAGRQAFFDGNIDDAAVALAAAYKHDPTNTSVQMLLPQALDNMSMRTKLRKTAHQSAGIIEFAPGAGSNKLAVAGADGSVEIWQNGQLQRTLPNEGALVSALAFDASGERLSAGGADGSIVMYDLRSGALKHIKHAHDGRVRALAYGKDALLASAGADDAVRMYDTGGTLVRTIHVTANGSKDARVNAIAFGPGGIRLITGTGTGAFEAWNVRTGAKIWSQLLDGAPAILQIAAASNGAVAATLSTGGVLYRDASGESDAQTQLAQLRFEDLAFNPGGTALALAGQDGAARLLDAGGGQTAVLTPAHPDAAPVPVTSVRFSPDGRFVAAGRWDGVVELFGADGTRIAVFAAHGAPVQDVRFSPGGTSVASVASDGTIGLWNVPRTLVFAGAHAGRVDRIIVARALNRFITVSRDGSAGVWDLNGVHRLFSLVHLDSDSSTWVSDAAFSADGSRLLTLGGPSAVLWNSRGRQIVRLNAKAGLRLSSGAFLPGGGFIIGQRSKLGESASSSDSKWFAYNKAGKFVSEQGGYQKDIQSIEVDSSGNYTLAVSPNTGYISLSRLPRAANEQLLSGISTAALLPGRAFYLTGTQDGAVQTRSLRTGSILNATPAGGARVSVLAISSSGDLVAWTLSGSTAIQVRALSARGAFADPGGTVALLGAAGEIQTLAFSPGAGTYVLAVCADGIARVWDRQSGEIIRAIVAPGKITAAAFSTGPSRIIVATDRGGVYVQQSAHVLGDPAAVAAAVRAGVDPHSLGANAAFKAAYQDLAPGGP